MLSASAYRPCSWRKIPRFFWKFAWVGQISTAMAQAGLNIHNMVNKSRGDMAYTLVDVDSPVTESVLATIRAIGGVLAVRYLPAQQ